MLPNERTRLVERHALVSAAWLPAGFVAAALIHHGLGSGGWPSILGGMAAILLGFIAHVIVNAVLETDFSPQEVALGLVVYGCGIIAIGLSSMFDDGPDAVRLMALAGGMAGLAAAAIFYMITRYGVRQAFENFNVVRDFNPRPSSRLPHRGGRR